jgi:hypothetical protein
MTVVNLRVSNPDGQQSNSFSFDITAPQPIAPNIVSISPVRGIVGATVTINGGNFVANSVVKFGSAFGVDVSVTSATQLSVKIPQVPVGSVPVSVQSPSGMVSNSVNMTIDATPAPAPTTSAFSPTSGAPGSTLSIAGANFVVGAKVRFGTTLGVNVNVASSTEITVQVPSMAPGNVNVVVENPDSNVSVGRSFLVTAPPPPNITNISPTSGPPGTVVTITGTGFTQGASALFGTNPGTNVTVVSPTQITVTVPSSAIGTTTLSLRMPTGTADVMFDITSLVPNPYCRMNGDKFECWDLNTKAWVVWINPSVENTETSQDVLIEMIETLNTTVLALSKKVAFLQSKLTEYESRELNADLTLAILRAQQGNIDLRRN